MKSVVVMLVKDQFEEREEEIKSLAETAGYSVIDVFTQLAKPRPRYLVGTGKVDEIKGFIENNGVGLVIFENLLSSRQTMSLEAAFGIPVIDKFDLILNVFEKHAMNKEAKLQIELVRLKRKVPYIKMFLSKKIKEEHPGFGGSGEFIIHSTITAIHDRIKKIEERLEKFQRRIDMQRRRRRKGGKIVSLVGYTNVGKTTLLNALAHENKAAKDELFTTLSTKTSALSLKGKTVFINDTIGFIRDLPHELIYAFRATLSDIRDSDLIFIVLDVSEPVEKFLRKKEICENTLIEINADAIPTLYVLNKNDKGHDFDKEVIPEEHILASAKYGDGLMDIRDKLEKMLI
ncbi:MAG: GTPase HflX [Candidatus Hydrothermarchaeales archaeon]